MAKNTQNLYERITGVQPNTSSETYKRFCLLVHYVKTGRQDKIQQGANERNWKMSTAQTIRNEIVAGGYKKPYS